MTEVPHHLRLDDKHPQRAANKRALIRQQMEALKKVGLFFLVWAVVEVFWPPFFSPFEWSRGTVFLADSVFAFWPLFIYAAGMAVVSLFDLVPSLRTGTSDEGHLVYDLTSSVLAGVWEELAFRCVLILAGMISIMFANYLWPWLVVGSVVAFSISLVKAKSDSWHPWAWRGLLAVLVISALPLFYFTWGVLDPVYWVYEKVIFKVLSAVSFGALDSILYYQGAPALFIMGAISANAKFRAGHKYQGPIGQLDAWIVGFIFLYAMLYHGLLTAIIIHAVYDIEIGMIRYLGRKVDRLEEG